MKDETEARVEKFVNFRKDIVVNGPYDEEYGKKAINPLFDDLDKLGKMFKDKTVESVEEEDSITNEELEETLGYL